MATIDDLENVSIEDMSEEELFSRLREIRQSRRTPKQKKKATKAPPKAKSTNDLVSMLSPEQRKALLEKLED